MNGTCLIFGICFFTAGILFILGKIHVRLAAWKAMPQEEKDNIKIEELCCNVGAVISLCGIIFMLAGLSAAFKEHCFVWAMIAWMILSGIDVYYIERKGKYYRT